MKTVVKAGISIALMSGLCLGQATLEVTGNPVPSDLLKANYGSLPKSIGAFDIDICNLTEFKQTVLSSKVYQSLAISNPGLQPVGRQLILTAILRKQAHRPVSILGVAISSMSGAIAVMSASKFAMPGNWATALAFASIGGQQLLNAIKPATTAEQIEKFETQVLEPSFLLDGGACEQRTVFTVSSPKTRATTLSFHVR